jgi:hypothetical protein
LDVFSATFFFRPNAWSAEVFFSHPKTSMRMGSHLMDLGMMLTAIVQAELAPCGSWILFYALAVSAV